MITFNIPEQALYILRILHEADEEAYIVGGCVRDLILGIIPHDWDITTSATPEKVKKLFRRTIDTGIEHGTVTVMMDKSGYEVTTYRIDGDYEDFRRPKEVRFSQNLKEDLLRRDFTMNAMAYNPEEGVVDLYGGVEDLKNEWIRCVGNPKERFREDALRMLRAIRFSAKLGFEIEEETYKAIQELAPLITHVSTERIQIEMTKTLLSKEPDKIRELVKCNLMEHIFPEFLAIVGVEQKNRYHRLTVDEHTYECLKNVEAEVRLRWSVYLHDVGKGFSKTTDAAGVDHFYGHQKISAELANKFLKHLHFDNKTITDVTHLIRVHDETIPLNERAVRRSMSRMGIEYFEDYLKIRAADVMGQSSEFMEMNLEHLDEVKKISMKIQEEADCLNIKDLAINGRDLIAVGIHKGIEIGQMLQELLEIVLDDPKLNTRDHLLSYVKNKKVEGNS